jgi:CRISPR system Cascade subunit CasB
MSARQYLTFIDRHGAPTAAGEALVAWYKELEGERGLRAALRRVRHPDDCVFIPGFHALRHALASYGYVAPEAMAVIAALVAHVKTHRSGVSLPARLRGKHGERAPLNDMRLRRLLLEDDTAELLRLLRRAIHILDGAVDIPDMAERVRCLCSPVLHDRAARDFAYAYYDALTSEERGGTADAADAPAA